MLRPFFVSACLLLAALPVRAQGQKFDLFGGYQFTSFQVLHGFAGNPPKSKGNGWDLAFSYHVNRWLGAKADFSGSYGSGGVQLGVSNGPTSLLTYTFGPIVSLPARRVTPFAEFLAGGYAEQVQYFATTPFHGLALMAGGGVDAKIKNHFALRVFEVDWLGFMNGYSYGLGYGAKSNFRFSTGLVLRF